MYFCDKTSVQGLVFKISNTQFKRKGKERRKGGREEGRKERKKRKKKNSNPIRTDFELELGLSH